MRKTSFFKKPLFLVAAAGVVYYLYNYAKTAYTALNLQPFIKGIRFEIFDIFTSVLKIDFSLYNKEAAAVTFNAINANVYYNNNLIGYINYTANQTIQPNTESPLNLQVKINNLSTAPELFQEITAISSGTPTSAIISIQGKITANNNVLPLNFEQVYKFNENKKLI
ncbi:MAG: hypothetical protein WCO13_00725 [Bacteroidota bacterium]